MQGQLEGVRVMPIHASIAAVLGRAGRIEEAMEWLLAPRGPLPTGGSRRCC